MMTAALEIGTEVGYAETFYGQKWVKIGTVVEIDGERARVKWSRWEFASGHVKQDSKRTWVKISKLIVRS